MIRFEYATSRHADLIARSMRPRDEAEIEAGWDQSPRDAMREALDASYFSRTMFYDLEPLAIYGLAPLSVLSGSARIWIFASSAIDRHPLSFARGSRRAAAELFQHTDLMTNLIDTGDAAAMRWMEWLGGGCVSPLHERGGRVFAQFVLVQLKEWRRCQRA